VPATIVVLVARQMATTRQQSVNTDRPSGPLPSDSYSASVTCPEFDRTADLVSVARVLLY
jgi:hypothetical protein